MRVTVKVRNLAGVIARRQARSGEQRKQIKAEIARSSVRVLAFAQTLTPVDTSFMVRHLRREITQDGFTYAVGWHAEDFIGAINPVTLRPILSFYPTFVVFGTRHMAGRDPLTPALERERPVLRRNLAAILSGRAAAARNG